MEVATWFFAEASSTSALKLSAHAYSKVIESRRYPREKGKGKRGEKEKRGRGRKEENEKLLQFLEETTFGSLIPNATKS